VPHEEIEIEEPEASAEPTLTEPAVKVAEPIFPAAPAVTETELVTYLRQELAAERVKLHDLEQRHAASEAALTTAVAAQDQLLPLVIEATQRMQIGLNQTPLEMGDLPVSVVVAQHAKVKAAFDSTFRVGRTSLDSAETHQDVPRMTVARQLGITPKDKGSVGSHPTWGR